MSSSDEDRHTVLTELREALAELSAKSQIPLREKAMVLEALERVEEELGEAARD